MEKKGGDRIYVAWIRYPGRKSIEFAKCPFAPGVTKQQGIWSDQYTGTAEALVAAGLVRESDLPGLPGSNKVRVSLSSDGIVFREIKGRARGKEFTEAGAKVITKNSRNTFRVCIYISQAEGKSRLEILRTMGDAHAARCRNADKEIGFDDIPPFVEAPARFAPMFWTGQWLEGSNGKVRVAAVKWADKWTCGEEVLPASYAYTFVPQLTATELPIVESLVCHFQPLKASVHALTAPLSGRPPRPLNIQIQTPGSIAEARQKKKLRCEELEALRDEIRVREKVIRLDQEKLATLQEKERLLLSPKDECRS